MNDVYRTQRYIYDLTRKYYLFGRDTLIAGLDLKPGDRVVEIGCGTARNLIKMARLYPAATFYGLDASEEMLLTARRAVARAGLTDRICLTQGYAEKLAPETFGLSEPFDCAIFSYSLSMIPDWKQSLRSASAAISDTGSICVVDFGDLAGTHAWAAKTLIKWLSLFHVCPRVEILQRLESAPPEPARESTKLRLLPARYAFIWQGDRKAVQALAI